MFGQKKIKQATKHITNQCWTRQDIHTTQAKAKVKQQQQKTRPTDKNRHLQFLAVTQQQQIRSSDWAKKK